MEITGLRKQHTLSARRNYKCGGMATTIYLSPIYYSLALNVIVDTNHRCVHCCVLQGYL